MSGAQPGQPCSSSQCTSASGPARTVQQTHEAHVPVQLLWHAELAVASDQRPKERGTTILQHEARAGRGHNNQRPALPQVRQHPRPRSSPKHGATSCRLARDAARRLARRPPASRAACGGRSARLSPSLASTRDKNPAGRTCGRWHTLVAGRPAHVHEMSAAAKWVQVSTGVPSQGRSRVVGSSVRSEFDRDREAIGSTILERHRIEWILVLERNRDNGSVPASRRPSVQADPQGMQPG